MGGLLASEGGYQQFLLDNEARTWLGISVVVSLLALAIGLVMMRNVLAKDTGNEKMGEIAGAVQEGAMAYITRQFRTIGVIVVPLAVVVFLTSEAIEKVGAG